MLHVIDMSLAFGGQVILDSASWHIKVGERVGLIGPNGAGKSTMLRIIAGRQEADSGSLSHANGLTIGYLEQDVQEENSQRTVLEEAASAFEEVVALRKEEEEIVGRMASFKDHDSDEYHALINRHGEIHQRLEAHESHRMEANVESILTGLGFDPADLTRPLESFSGGWRMRVVLAKMLLRQPDLLLLDEPTNHLDIESIAWLEGYLRTYKGSVVLVSHDRYFLDRMVSTTAELSLGKITKYDGNYTFYLKDREERRALHKASYENQQKEIQQTERFIQRFRAKATKARQVQSRVKYLEKLERIPAPPQESGSIRFRFPDPPRGPRTPLTLSRYSKIYSNPHGDPIEVFKDAEPLTIERGDKIALIGKNGAGKSTLARMLLGSEDFAGERKLGINVELTYFAQHQADTIPGGQTVLQAITGHAQDTSETQVRSILGAFLFNEDDTSKPIEALSGGERSRLALAITLLRPANFLILDEPTNHLDIQSIGVLMEALNQYSGTFVVVSHDRHFLDKITNRIWAVGNGRVRDYPGTYSEYMWRLGQEAPTGDGASAGGGSGRPVAVKKAEKPATPSRRKTKEEKRLEAEERNRRYRERQNAGSNGEEAVQDASEWAKMSPQKLKRSLEDVERKIEAKEKQKAVLEEKLADPDFYTQGAESAASIAEFQELQESLERLYTRWEEIGTHMNQPSS